MRQNSDRTWIQSPSAGDASKLTIHERRVGDVTVLKLSGELQLDDGELAFRTSVQALLAMERTKIVVDLAGVTHIDSSGAGMLVAKLQTVRKLGGDIRLVQPAARYQRLLTTMRVLSLFKVFDDEAAAVDSYGQADLPIH